MGQRDVMLRLLEQLSLVIRRLLHGAGPEDLVLASDRVDEALVSHLGDLHAVLERLEPASAATLIHDPERLYGYAQLVGLKAAIARARGLPDAAELQARTVALALEVRARMPDCPEEWQQWIRDLEADASRDR